MDASVYLSLQRFSRNPTYFNRKIGRGSRGPQRVGGRGGGRQYYRRPNMGSNRGNPGAHSRVNYSSAVRSHTQQQQPQQQRNFGPNRTTRYYRTNNNANSNRRYNNRPQYQQAPQRHGRFTRPAPPHRATLGAAATTRDASTAVAPTVVLSGETPAEWKSQVQQSSDQRVKTTVRFLICCRSVICCPNTSKSIVTAKRFGDCFPHL